MLAAERALELFGSEPNPNLSAQLTACMAGPLQMSFDSTMNLFIPASSSGGFSSGTLSLGAHVSANSVPLRIDPVSLVYEGSGTLNYNSLTGTYVPMPPLSDCGSSFIGMPGAVSVLGELDLNIDPYTISDPSQIRINLQIIPSISEQIIYMINIPSYGCLADPSQPAFYEAFWLIAHPVSSPLAPAVGIPVNIDIPAIVTDNTQIPGGTANGTATIILSPQ
jgi:hypothetical protein